MGNSVCTAVSALYKNTKIEHKEMLSSNSQLFPHCPDTVHKELVLYLRTKVHFSFFVLFCVVF